MFLFRAVDALSGSINRLVLGSVAPVAMLGEYAGAERITRVFQQGMWPVKSGALPEIDASDAERFRACHEDGAAKPVFSGRPRFGFRLAIYLGAPLLVRFALGPGFENSVLVLRVFAFWIPLIALSTVLIFQVLLPNHLDNQFNLATFTSALVSIAAAVLLAPNFGAVGIAWSAVIAQLYTLIAYSILARRAGLNPFARTTPIGRSSLSRSPVAET
jgi:polysaccharide transporter, PST family